MEDGRRERLVPQAESDQPCVPEIDAPGRAPMKHTIDHLQLRTRATVTAIEERSRVRRHRLLALLIFQGVVDSTTTSLLSDRLWVVSSLTSRASTWAPRSGGLASMTSAAVASKDRPSDSSPSCAGKPRLSSPVDTPRLPTGVGIDRHAGQPPGL